MAQFVLINVLVAVLMKKLEDSNETIDTNAEMDEEIEQQLEPDVHDRNIVEQSLLDVNALHVKEKVILTKL
ncbi:unnamed protein product [Rotaria sp. Silwood1]|nr:unnamed protein product [Rotaria sp. Silwood1]